MRIRGAIVNIAVAAVCLGAAYVGALPPSLQDLSQTQQVNEYGQVLFIPEAILQAQPISELGLNKGDWGELEVHVHPAHPFFEPPRGPLKDTGAVFPDPNCVPARKPRRSAIGTTLPEVLGRAASALVGTVEGVLDGYSPAYRSAGRLLEVRIEELVGDAGVPLGRGDIVWALELGADLQTKDGVVCDQPRIGDFRARVGDRVFLAGGVGVKSSNLFESFMLFRVSRGDIEIPTELGYEAKGKIPIETIFGWVETRTAQ